MILDARRGNILVPKALLHISNSELLDNACVATVATHGTRRRLTSMLRPAFSILHDDIVINGAKITMLVVSRRYCSLIVPQRLQTNERFHLANRRGYVA